MGCRGATTVQKWVFGRRISQIGVAHFFRTSLKFELIYSPEKDIDRKTKFSLTRSWPYDPGSGWSSLTWDKMSLYQFRRLFWRYNAVSACHIFLVVGQNNGVKNVIFYCPINPKPIMFLDWEFRIKDIYLTFIYGQLILRVSRRCASADAKKSCGFRQKRTICLGKIAN